MLQKCNHANNLYTVAKKLLFTYLKAARKMDWQQAEGQLVKVDTTAKLKQEINCFFFKLLHSVQWVKLCSKSVVILNTYNSSQKVIVHVSESGQKNGLAASRGSISQSWHCSKIKTRAGAVLCSKVRTILWRQGGGGAAVGLLAPAVSLIWLEKRSFPNWVSIHLSLCWAALLENDLGHASHLN